MNSKIKKILLVLIMLTCFCLNVNAENKSVEIFKYRSWKKLEKNTNDKEAVYAVHYTKTDSCSKYSSDIAQCVSHFVINSKEQVENCKYLIVQQDKTGSGNLDSMSKEFCTSSLDDSCLSHDTNGVNCSNTTNSEKTSNCVIASAYDISGAGKGS